MWRRHFVRLQLFSNHAHMNIKSRQVPKSCGPMISSVELFVPGGPGKWLMPQHWNFGVSVQDWSSHLMCLCCKTEWVVWFMLIITTNLLIHIKLLNFNAAQVEKNWSCIKMSQDGFPNSCIFPDILDLVANPPKKCNWDPAKLTLVPKAQCAQHKEHVPHHH